jgi:hypothetical protein
MPYPPRPQPSDPRNAPGSNSDAASAAKAARLAKIDGGVQRHDAKQQSHLEQLWSANLQPKGMPTGPQDAAGAGLIRVIGTPIAAAWDLIDTMGKAINPKKGGK